MSRHSVFMSRQSLIKAKSFYVVTEYSCVATEFDLDWGFYVATESSRTWGFHAVT